MDEEARELIRGIEGHPEEWDRYLAASDKFDEVGDELMVRALRYMAKHHTKIRQLPPGLWGVAEQDYVNKERYYLSLIPKKLARIMSITDFACWTTWESAARSLGQGVILLESSQQEK